MFSVELFRSNASDEANGKSKLYRHKVHHHQSFQLKNIGIFVFFVFFYSQISNHTLYVYCPCKNNMKTKLNEATKNEMKHSYLQMELKMIFAIENLSPDF